ncbi:hypothetical protein BDM02DRAFT_2342502 [Thelephora ganbajun]|uniref:Uncharacterized protein n=1 Tax=Thelephora ganbajun TaxID=370292 RepID=A0ACB6ZF34_THEGA|nr:hypothetical protein BDM02DRAFT_2342502 [Thelephora ganbajun]
MTTAIHQTRQEKCGGHRLYHNHSTSDSSSIFKDGKLKPGIYKIQNVYTETYLDIEVHSREMCCRPAKDLGEGRGLRVDRGKPGQFCIPLNGVQNCATLRVAAYPVAWRVEIVNDDRHRGFEYVRFYWGTEAIAWDLGGGNKENGYNLSGEHFPLADMEVNPHEDRRHVHASAFVTRTTGAGFSSFIRRCRRAVLHSRSTRRVRT